MNQELLTSGAKTLPLPSIGVLWMVLATLLFVSLDSIAKYLVQSYPVPQVVWARYCFHLLFLLILLNRRMVQVIVTRRLRLQCLRSIMLLLATAFYFWGLRYVPLAKAASIMMVSPIIVTTLSVPLLKESVGVHRWLGVLAGFAGALIILKPGGDIVSLAALLPLGAAIMYALYQISTRLLSRADLPMTTLVYTSLFGALIASCAVPFAWTQPDAKGWALMGMTGLLGGLGHFSLIKAFQHSNAAVISPFNYTSLLWAIIYGILLFGEYPEIKTLAGAAIVLCSGLYIFKRERSIAHDSRHLSGPPGTGQGDAGTEGEG
jgi:drug/metabolite transporter (DMT)-like permease